MIRPVKIQFSKYILYVFSLFLLFLPGLLYSQSLTFSEKLTWNRIENIKINKDDSLNLISFMGSTNLSREYGTLPVFTKRVTLQDELKETEVTLVNLKFVAFSPEELRGMRNIEKIGQEIRIEKSIEVERRMPFLMVSFLPIRKNASTDILEKLVSFDLQINFSSALNPIIVKPAKEYADNSVLGKGSWYKLSVNATGIYRISYTDLNNMGINPQSVDPRNIRIYGNGGGMLPEANALPRIDDLRENAIFVSGEEDGQFNDGDYILFYGESPDLWSFNLKDQLFHHSKNVYTDFNYYFLTYDNGPGKRIESQPSTQQPATDVIDRFNDFTFYEKDDINLIKSGREWYDKDIFDITTSRQYSFNFPNPDDTYPAILQASIAARSTSGPTSFSISANNQQIMNIPVASVSSDWLAEYAKAVTKSDTLHPSGSSSIDVKMVFNKNGHEATGWLNYLELNVMRHLIMSGPQTAFRSIDATKKDKVYQYNLASNGQQLTIWDITSPSDIKTIIPSQTGTQYIFRLASDTLIHEFMAFDGSGFHSVSSAVSIANQDLHGAGNFDYVIITHPNFINQAERLAQFHRDHDNFTVLVTTPDIIYNEFSSGAQDLSAIRDFLKMMYDKSGSGMTPKYLLLFGDGSYDYKDRVQGNTNFIPSYESPESLAPVDSYVTDDFFVLLDNNEGQGASGALDVGVGRFPVKTVNEAEDVVAKIEHYCENSDTVKNDWRNVISFVAEDWDNNLHLNQTEELTDFIEQNYKDYNVDKIYLDAYQALPTPGGLRNPDVNDAINKRMKKGALIMNYTGHGGTLGWAHERVLEIPDIKSWTNFDNMPAFMTATCEFSQFDDPSFVSAGEWVFLNPKGGGIALFTTTRPTFAGSNSALAHNFYNNAFKKTDGKYPKMGDLILNAKNATGGSANSRKFILLGDPALQLAYPQESIVTTSINNKTFSSLPDTIKALAEVSVSGEIRYDAGIVMTGFNGTLFPTVYDKSSKVYTLGNTGGTQTQFYLRKNIIYKGKVAVTEGKFSFTFIVPKDIAYNYGIGKISYYARNQETDANGYDSNLIVGGYNNNAITDDNGPEIKLYMNNTAFVPGGITSQNPDLLAIINDTSGINTVGNGIGHDLTAVLDENSQDAKILNDYYVSDINTFKSGMVLYPYSNLSDGPHTIRLKAWDVYNNSSEATIDFVVASSADFAFQHLMNYPNPFLDRTTFSFEYNQSSTPIDAQILIYSLNGDLIKTIDQQIYTNGYRSQQIEWDGITDSGRKIASGTYVYRVRLKLPNGSAVQLSSKMVVLR
jgi:Peptidase family C25